MFDLQPVPASLFTVLSFAQFLARTHAPASVQNYLAGVCTLHKVHGALFPDLSAFAPRLILKGIAKLNPVVVKQASPITPQILLSILTIIDPINPLHVTFWAAALIAFFSFARGSNLFAASVPKFETRKHLCRANISSAPSGLLVTFVWSKTMQAGGRIHQVPVCAIPGSPLCPLRAYTSMLKMIPAPQHKAAFCLSTPVLTPMTKPFLSKHSDHSLISWACPRCCLRVTVFVGGGPPMPSNAASRGNW